MRKKVLCGLLISALVAMGTMGLSVSAQEESTEAATESVTESLSEASTLELEDGVYSAEFVTDSKMFHANEACEGKGTLTVKDGQMHFHVSLQSKKILHLYLGKAADAEKALKAMEAGEEEENLLDPTTDTVTYSDGMTDEVFGFEFPVEKVGEDFDLALIGTHGNWYDHVVSIQNPERIGDVEAVTEATTE